MVNLGRLAHAEAGDHGASACARTGPSALAGPRARPAGHSLTTPRPAGRVGSDQPGVGHSVGAWGCLVLCPPRDRGPAFESPGGKKPGPGRCG